MRNWSGYWKDRYNRLLESGLTAKPHDIEDNSWYIPDEDFVYEDIVIKAQRLKSIVNKYSLSVDEFVEHLDTQAGRCKICDRYWNEFKTGLHIDHCHETGRVRGLLCSMCNRGIGCFKDDPDLLNKEILYLDENGDY